MEVQVEKHRNGVTSIMVRLVSIPDAEGNETNNYYGRKPTYKDAKGKEHPVILSLIEGEARRLITAGRATPVGKPKAKAAPANKMVKGTTNK